MKSKLLIMFALVFLLSACKDKKAVVATEKATETSIATIEDMKSALNSDLEKSDAKKFVPTMDENGWNWTVDKFADKKVIRYKIPGWDKLSLDQKKLVYYLTQAGLSGRDIMYDQNYRHNLKIRRALENVYLKFKGDKSTKGWMALETYLKEIWFANGIHHHYSMEKFKPGFSKEYLVMVMGKTGTRLDEESLRAIFDPSFDNKKVNLNPDKGLVKGSAVNFYDPDITEAEVDDYYKRIMADKSLKRPVSFGLNSKLVRGADGQLVEKVYRSGGMYGAAIDEIVQWLEKAVTVAENKPQAAALKLLIKYYKTGDLKTWDDYNVVWAGATAGDIDYINSFIEVYNDPKGYSGSYETVIQINDFDASARMSVVMNNVQWFEDNSPLLPEHKKKKVTGVTYKVVNVAGEAGDSSPSTPIGVNLPNANWIRAEVGSKSVSLGNIIAAYGEAGGSGMLSEFAYNEEEIEKSRKYGAVADKLHTALHEVVGHASGQIEDGVGTPKETLKNYASTLEEARADLVALYYLMDPKLIELGLMESLEVGKESYESYIRNGLMLQLRRLEEGKDIEESHMRNRQLNAKWVFEKGAADKVITKEVKDGKTYFVVNDYEKLRVLFGDLLREIQRIKSQGDYEAGRALVENYGVKVDRELHKEVLARAAKLNSAPYGGFVNPVLVPVKDASGNITDVKVSHTKNFIGQMIEYSRYYNFLPDDN